MQVERNAENLKQCQCRVCPSYSLSCKIKAMPQNAWHMLEGLDKSQHFEGLYCAFEKSSCIEENKGCFCDVCDVNKHYDLHKQSYCLSSGGK